MSTDSESRYSQSLMAFNFSPVSRDDAPQRARYNEYKEAISQEKLATTLLCQGKTIKSLTPIELAALISFAVSNNYIDEIARLVSEVGIDVNTLYRDVDYDNLMKSTDFVLSPRVSRSVSCLLYNAYRLENSEDAGRHFGMGYVSKVIMGFNIDVSALSEYDKMLILEESMRYEDLADISDILRVELPELSVDNKKLLLILAITNIAPIRGILTLLGIEDINELSPNLISAFLHCASMHSILKYVIDTWEVKLQVFIDDVEALYLPDTHISFGFAPEMILSHLSYAEFLQIELKLQDYYLLHSSEHSVGRPEWLPNIIEQRHLEQCLVKSNKVTPEINVYCSWRVSFITQCIETKNLQAFCQILTPRIDASSWNEEGDCTDHSLCVLLVEIAQCAMREEQAPQLLMLGGAVFDNMMRACKNACYYEDPYNERWDITLEMVINQVIVGEGGLSQLLLFLRENDVFAELNLLDSQDNLESISSVEMRKFVELWEYSMQHLFFNQLLDQYLSCETNDKSELKNALLATSFGKIFQDDDDLSGSSSGLCQSDHP
ncbi:MAG: hypothetical protein COA94_02570 [Rickettsiales bacterium]|nr:MAG: hypothetical protein COA94_02570 [Rickettsiales bacterium]